MDTRQVTLRVGMDDLATKGERVLRITVRLPSAFPESDERVRGRLGGILSFASSKYGVPPSALPGAYESVLQRHLVESFADEVDAEILAHVEVTSIELEE